MANEERREPFWMFGYPDDYEPDVLDDDYWKWVMYRKPVTGLLRIEELSRKLQREAEEQQTLPTLTGTETEGR